MSPTFGVTNIIAIDKIIYTIFLAQMGVVSNADYAPQGLFLAFGSNLFRPDIAVMTRFGSVLKKFPPKLAQHY